MIKFNFKSFRTLPCNTWSASYENTENRDGHAILGLRGVLSARVRNGTKKDYVVSEFRLHL